MLHAESRIRKVDNRINLIKKQENPGTTKAHREASGKLRSGNADKRIPGIPHSAVQQQDTNRRETVKKLIQQFESHPNKEFFLQDLKKDRRD